MHRGYIKIWRKLEDSGLLQMHGTLALFMYMLLKASYKETKYGLVTLDRGQFVAGRHQLAKAINLTEQQLRTCEKRLIDLGMVSSKSTNKFTIYTIVNYDIYQSTEDDSNKQITNEQQANNKQLTTKEEVKKLKSKEDNTRFAEFWEVWPSSKRKGGKSNCLKVWRSRNLDSEADQILAHVKYCKGNGVWKDPQYIEAPLVYLNKSKWDGAEIADKKQPFNMDNFLKAVNGQ